MVALAPAYRAAVDWLPHLRGACGCDPPAMAVERQARRVVGQPAVRQQAPNLGFRLFDQCLIAEIVNATGQRGMPVRHRLGVDAIASPERTEIVGPGVAFGEERAVTG